MRLLYAALFLMISSFAYAQSASPNPAKLYAVIFDVTVNSAGKVETLKVAKVIDPSTHSTDAVNAAVPDSYLSAAKALFDQDQLRPRSNALQHVVILRPGASESRGHRSAIRSTMMLS